MENEEAPMGVMHMVTLYFTEGRTDKFYQMIILRRQDHYVLASRWGRRSSITGTQTGAKPADKVLGTSRHVPRLIDEGCKRIRQKVMKGYTRHVDGRPYTSTPASAEAMFMRVRNHPITTPPTQIPAPATTIRLVDLAATTATDREFEWVDEAAPFTPAYVDQLTSATPDAVVNESILTRDYARVEEDFLALLLKQRKDREARESAQGTLVEVSAGVSRLVRKRRVIL